MNPAPFVSTNDNKLNRGSTSSMGISVVVDVEKENRSPIEKRTDGKPLADVVAGWIWYPSVVDMLGLSDSSTETLQKVEMSSLESYSSPEKNTRT